MFDFLFPNLAIPSKYFISVEPDEDDDPDPMRDEEEKSNPTRDEQQDPLMRQNFVNWQEEMINIGEIRSWWIRGFFLLIMLLIGSMFGLYAFKSNLFKTKKYKRPSEKK